jgi:hypothetical protein
MKAVTFGENGQPGRLLTEQALVVLSRRDLPPAEFPIARDRGRSSLGTGPLPGGGSVAVCHI